MTLLARALFLALLFLPQAPASADEPKPTQEQVREITNEAAALLRSEGLDAARRRFMTSGRFLYGEVYVNVIDENGTWLIYPPNPRNEGKSVFNVRDADGKLLVQEIIRVARESGEGWVEYRWLNPVSNRIEPKLTYVKRVPERGYITYVGVYR